MNLPKEIVDAHAQDLLAVAQLAVAFTHLSMAPYDSWGHEGSPAEMAVWVVLDARNKGRMGMLRESLQLDTRYYGRR